MTARDFCYWMQGYFELADADAMTAEQVNAVKRHLSMVFAHEIDPSMGDAQHQADLQHAHDAVPSPSTDGNVGLAPDPLGGPFPFRVKPTVLYRC